ncbi:MAG: hypothetical protein L6Q46_00835, partial [Flavobacterium sp.]|nr:hypothetical protein [Flavobacterium sp.]
MKKVILLLFFFTGFNVFSQAGSSPCDALQLYPYTSCGNQSGPQYAGHYQTEEASGNNVPMTGTSTINPACTTDNETAQSVRWIEVVATTTSFTITNLTDYSGAGAATAEQRDYVVFSGTCSSLTQIACGASIPINGTLNVTGLTTGQTYYIMVSQSAAAFSGYPTANAAATCITSTVPHVASNDACSNAFVLQNNVSYTSTNADSTADGPSVCQNPASGSVENNVWYQWCAPANWPVGQLAYLNVNNQVCNSTQGLQLSIYGPGTTCAQITAGTATSVVCQNPGSTTDYNYTFTATANQCYLIVLDGFAGTSCTYDIQVSASLICDTPPVAPTVTVTQPTCAITTGTIVVTAPLGATLEYSINDVVYQSGTTFSGLVPGSYNVTVRNTTTDCVSTATVVVINPPAGAPPVPTITTTAPTCVANGFSQISNYVGGTTYTFTPAGPTVDGTGLISGMILGTSYTVTATVGSCTSAASASFTNLATLTVPSQPTISTTAPTCSSDGISTITNYNGALIYTFTPAGPTAGAGGLISGMTVGTSYTVTASNGSCSSVASASFSNAAMLVTPAVPTITTTAPTCVADGTSTITNYNAANTYTFTPAGPTVGAGGLISGMVVSTSYTVTSGNGSCTSVASASFTNLATLAVPSQPTISTTAPTCSSDGISTITNYNGALIYTFIPAGPTAGAGGLISGMTVGTSYTVTASNGSCSSVASASFSNAAMLVTPAVPTITTTAPTCVADGTST